MPTICPQKFVVVNACRFVLVRVDFVGGLAVERFCSRGVMPVHINMASPAYIELNMQGIVMEGNI